MLEFLVGFFIGTVLYKTYIDIKVKLLEKRLEERIELTLTQLKKSIINSKIEVDNGVYYLYNRETNEFIAQGNTFDELEKAAKTKFPDKLFNVPQKELNEIIKD